MAYGIVINLDYENNPADTCKFLWQEINDRMLKAGFNRDGRIFTISLPEKEACDRARKVVDSIEDHLEYHRKHLHKYMTDFYGFPLQHRTNLLLPPADSIVLEEIEDRRSRPR